MENSNRGLESPPAGFERFPRPRNYFEIQQRITRSFARQEPLSENPVEVEVVDGFEDVLPEPLGAGFFYNTPTSVHQLNFVLSVASHATIDALLADKTIPPSEFIKDLREKKVLSGLKIIDLGCGRPFFAIAAQALGARAYTTDIEDISERDKKYIERHTILNLNQPNAIDALLDSTGGDFDIVSENIIGSTPGMRRNVSVPKPERITDIAGALLKQNGYLYYSSKSYAAADRMLRKK